MVKWGELPKDFDVEAWLKNPKKEKEQNYNLLKEIEALKISAVLKCKKCDTILIVSGSRTIVSKDNIEPIWQVIKNLKSKAMLDHYDKTGCKGNFIRIG